MKKVAWVLLFAVILAGAFWNKAYAATVERFKVSGNAIQALFNYGDFFSGGTLFGDTQILLETGVQRLNGDKTPFVTLEYFTHKETLNPLVDIIDINDLLEFSCDNNGQCVTTNSRFLGTMSFNISSNSASIKADLMVYERESGAIIPASVDLQFQRSAPYEGTNTTDHFKSDPEPPASNAVETIIRFRSKSAPTTVTGTVTLESMDVSTDNDGGTLFNLVNGTTIVVK